MRIQYWKFIFVLVIFGFLGIVSCGSNRFLPKNHANIAFHSVYEKDKITVTVNDSLRFDEHSINMIFEWGVSGNASFLEQGKIFRIRGQFDAVEEIDYRFDMLIERTLKFDTVINAENGRYINFFARHDEVVVEQYKKRIKVE